MVETKGNITSINQEQKSAVDYIYYSVYEMCATYQAWQSQL